MHGARIGRDNLAAFQGVEVPGVIVGKSAPLALTIPTFVNRVGYGNVWELGPGIDLAEGSPLPLEGSAVILE